jgi:hypothetical protein
VTGRPDVFKKSPIGVPKMGMHILSSSLRHSLANKSILVLGEYFLVFNR